MKYTLLNGESVEIDYLGQSSEGLEKLYYKFGIKFRDINGEMVYQDQFTFQERQSQRRRGRSVKAEGPEKALARMMADFRLETTGRDSSLMELLIHLRRLRLKRRS